MQYFEKFSKNLSNITGISQTPIELFVYSIIAIIIIDLLYRGIIFLNNTLNRNGKKLYRINKKTRIVKFIITFVVLFLIWEKQIQSIITFLSIIGAAATLALRDIISNFFAGIYIQLYKPFRLEDRI